MTADVINKVKHSWNSAQASAFDATIRAVRYNAANQSSTGEERVLTLRQYLEDVIKVPVDSTDSEETLKQAKVRHIPLWVFAELHDRDTCDRKKGAARGTALVFDLDSDGTFLKDMEIEAALANVRKWRRPAAIQTSINHEMSGKGKRYRIIVPVSAPYDMSKHTAIREALGYRLFGRQVKADATTEVVDSRTEDPTRGYFQPAHWRDRPAPHTEILEEGKPIDCYNYICRRTFEGRYFWHLAVDLRRLGHNKEQAISHMKNENVIINTRSDTFKHDDSDLARIVTKVYDEQMDDIDEHNLFALFQLVQDNQRKRGAAKKSIIELRNLVACYNPRLEVCEGVVYLTRRDKELCMSDDVLANLQCDVEATVGYIYPKGDIDSQLRAEAGERSFDKVLDYLHGLPPWDGKERWRGLIKYKEKEGYEELMSKFMVRWAIAMVGIRHQPDAHVQEVPTLIGAMGKGKSRRWASLMPEASMFTDNLKTFERTPQNAAMFDGRWAILIDEIDRFGTKVGNGELKHGVTGQDMQVVAKYKTYKDGFKKRFCYLAACNPIELWRDPEGQRRFLPMEVEDMPSEEHLSANKDQMWAEALHRYRDRERWHYSEEETASLMTLNESYYVQTDDIQKLSEFADKLKDGMSYMELKRMLYPHRERITPQELAGLKEACLYFGWRLVPLGPTKALTLRPKKG